MKIIAHRGASADAPENTLRAFDLARTQEADGLEMDIHTARDGTPVVIHDATLDRTSSASGAVSSMDVASLEALGVPVLSEILLRYGADMMLFVEAKTREATLSAAAQIDLLRKDGLPDDDVILIGFDHEALAEARALYPSLTIGASFASPVEPLRTKESACTPQWLVVRYDLISVRTVTEARQTGLKMAAWTVNERREARRLNLLGVDAMITGNPLKARDWLDDD